MFPIPTYTQHYTKKFTFIKSQNQIKFHNTSRVDFDSLIKKLAKNIEKIFAHAILTFGERQKFAVN